MHVRIVPLVAVMRGETSIPKVVVVDIGDVSDARVGDIDLVEIAATHAIPGDERFTKTQRTPAKAAAETDSDTEVAAKPADQRGSIVRASINRTGSPSPPAASIDPTAIVERSESPRRIINPRPSPRVFPNPVTSGVRRPTGIHPRGPYLPVLGSVAPASVFVEIIGTHHVRRDVTCRLGIVATQIAVACPLVE